MDFIGVVIPVHNRCHELALLLDSLSIQNGYNIEILVVDNGSTDDLMAFKFNSNVTILSLAENCGAASGFNKGVRYLLNRRKYKYIWLLDSDLIASRNALSYLVEIMDRDASIGICGSIIYNSNNRDIIVEAGASVDLMHGVVNPLRCNEFRQELPDMSEVDYVGSGVSLLRTEMVAEVGLYDERYHFLWEDMDYGLKARQYGWRVVVSSKSEVYHPPFTEKRNPNIYAYYGVRNPLITVSKYLSGIKLLLSLYFNLYKCLRIGLLMLLSGCHGFAMLTFKAISDFISGRFGKADLLEIASITSFGIEISLTGERLVYIIATGSHDAIAAVVSAVRDSTPAEIVLVVQSYRLNLLSDIKVDSVITYDDHSPRIIREYLKVGTEILRQRGRIINTDLKITSPISYFSSQVYDWDFSREQLYLSRLNIFSVCKPIASIIIGNILALFFLPIVWVAALKHKQQNQAVD